MTRAAALGRERGASMRFSHDEDSGRQASRLPWVRRLSAVTLAALLILGLSSCQKEKAAEPERRVNVRVWPAETKRVRPYLETTGTLKAFEEVVVSSEVDGILKQIGVDEGSPVHPGMLLAEINETDYRLDWKRSDAALRQARASLDNARAEYQRKEALYREELITKQQFDDVSTRVALAEAELERIRATLSISQEKLERTKIRSPLTGAVKERKVSAGDYVRNGTPLFQLIKIDPLKLNFTVREKDVAALKIGQEVVFRVDAFPGRSFSGRVHLLYPNVEERTRTLQAEALVPNPGHVLKPGYFARVQIFTGAERDTVVVPVTALMYDGTAVRIFVVTGDTARERPIQTGNPYGEYMEVIQGLKEKEPVVVVGQNNLSDGVKVHVAR